MPWLRDAVLRSRAWPILGGAYRALYRGATIASSFALQAVDGVDAVWLHRGMTREGWEPGVSDIDLILMRSPLAPSGEQAFLRRLESRLQTLKSAFPMLGDLWIGEPAEIERYLRWGGLRAWEDPPSWRRFAGAMVPSVALAESPEKRASLDPWVWAFVSYMELTRRLLRPQGSAEKREADLRKFYLDLFRYAEFAGMPERVRGPFPRTREEMRQSCPSALESPVRSLWLDASQRLASASRAVLARVGGPDRATPAFPEAGADSHVEALSRAALSTVPAGSGVVFDPPYHTHLLLPDGASEGAYLAAADALAVLNLPGVPLVLDPSTWALCLQSSYLGAPLGWASEAPQSPGARRAPGRGRRAAAAGGLFSDWSTTASGTLPENIPLLPPRLRWEVAAEAASWMSLWWRYLWIAPGWDDRFVLFHLYTRALGLGLLLDGAASGPFSDPAGLLARSAERFPGRAPLFAPFERLCRGEALPALNAGRRLEWTPEHLEALAGLNRTVFPPSESEPPAADDGAVAACGATTIAARPKNTTVSALFVGNSFTFHDDALSPHDLPGTVARLAARGGITLESRVLASAGASLERHWTEGRFAEALSSRRWDFVVLQDRSASALGSPSSLEIGAQLCARAASGAGARIVLFATWLGADRAPADWERVDEAYRRLGERLGAAVARVGAAWQAALAEGLPLYASDGEHAGPLGSYLAACTLHETLFGAGPSDDEPAAELRRLRSIARDAARPERAALR